MEPVFQKVSTKSEKIEKNYSRKIREHDSYAFRKTDRRHDMLLVSWSFLYLLFQFLLGNVQHWELLYQIRLNLEDCVNSS